MQCRQFLLTVFIIITHRIKSRIVKLIALIIKHDAEISHAAIAIAIMNGIPAFWNVFR